MGELYLFIVIEIMAYDNGETEPLYYTAVSLRYTVHIVKLSGTHHFLTGLVQFGSVGQCKRRLTLVLQWYFLKRTLQLGGGGK